MATPAQITANRANAQKSTGPRTDAGKSVSRFNALKHGIDAQSATIPGEDPAEYNALAAQYREDLQPSSPTEAFHVETMIRADWQKRRLQSVETGLYRTLLAENPNGNLADALLTASPAAKLLHRIQRELAACERTWYRAHAQIRHDRTRARDAEEAAFLAFLDRPLPALSAHDLASLPENPATFPSARIAPPMPAVDRLANPALRL